MAYAELNPVFTEFKGRVGNIVFYKRLGKQCMRVYVMPRNPDTESQRLNRHAFRDAVLAWKDMSREEKDCWNTKARYAGKPLRGYNLYISEYMKRNAVHAGMLTEVQVPGTACHETVPLRSAYGSAPFTQGKRDGNAFTAGKYVPG